LSIEDRKTEVVHAMALETETCDYVVESDLVPGNELIWRYHGAPYNVIVKAVHGKYEQYAGLDGGGGGGTENQFAMGAKFKGIGRTISCSCIRNGLTPSLASPPYGG
jgi:hypothetical protein